MQKSGNQKIGVQERSGRTDMASVWLSLARVLLLAFLLGVCSSRSLREEEEKVIKPTVEIMIFGDSLARIAERYIGKELQDAAEKRYTNSWTKISVSGEGGNRAVDLMERVDKDVLRRYDAGKLLPPPQAVLILFDSDAAEVEETEDTKQILRKEYKENLEKLIIKIKKSVKYICVGGPILYGELPRGRNPRDEQMNAYAQINKDLSQRMNIKYIDLRGAFQHADAVARWKKLGGLNTEDGEHPTKKGASILGHEYIKTITGPTWSKLWHTD